MSWRTATVLIAVGLLTGCDLLPGSKPTPGMTEAGAASASASSAAAPVATSTPVAPAPNKPVEMPPVKPMKLAPCGKLAALGVQPKAFPLLGGLLNVAALEGTSAPPREYSVMWAPKSQEQETRTMVRAGDDRFVVLAKQLFQLAPSPDRFEEEAKKFLKYAYSKRAKNPSFETLDLGSGMRAVAAVPKKLEGFGDAALMLAMVVAVPGGVLYDVAFYVSPQLANAGCQKMARQIAETLRPGSRTLDRSARSVVLDPRGSKLTMKLPADYVLVTQPGPDFVAMYVHKLVPLGQVPGDMYLYLGSHPERDEQPGDKVVYEGKLLGKPVQWKGSKDAKGGHVSALAPLSHHESLLVRLEATRSPEFLDELRKVAETIAHGK